MVWLWLLTLARRRNSPRSSSLLFPRSDTVGLFLLSPLNIPTVRGPPRPSKRTVLQPADPTCCMLQEARSEVLFCGGPWRGGRQREKHGIPSARIGRATLSRGTFSPYLVVIMANTSPLDALRGDAERIFELVVRNRHRKTTGRHAPGSARVGVVAGRQDMAQKLCGCWCRYGVLGACCS